MPQNEIQVTEILDKIFPRNSPQYSAMKPVAEELLAERMEKYPNDRINITGYQLYERFVRNSVNKQYEDMISKSEKRGGADLSALQNNMNGLLTKVAAYMNENNLQKIDENDLNKILNQDKKKVEIAKNLLDTSSLIEKDGINYEFQKELRDYFIARKLSNELLKNHTQAKTSNLVPEQEKKSAQQTQGVNNNIAPTPSNVQPIRQENISQENVKSTITDTPKPKTETTTPPSKKWGTLDLEKTAEDRKKLENRMRAIQTTHDIRLIQLHVFHHIRAKQLEQELGRKKPDPVKVDQLRGGIAILDNLLEKQKATANQVRELNTNVLNAADQMVEDLKELYATNGEDLAVKEKYNASYNNVVDQLANANAFNKSKDFDETEGQVVLWSKVNQRYAAVLNNIERLRARAEAHAGDPNESVEELEAEIEGVLDDIEDEEEDVFHDAVDEDEKYEEEEDRWFDALSHPDLIDEESLLGPSHLKKVTLESSYAGALFDDISWGTTWSIEPDAPLKQFWKRMSRDVASSAKGDIVEVHVFEYPVANSAFTTDEMDTISARIKAGELKEVHMYVHELEKNKKDRLIYVMDSLPNADELKEDKYKDAYIFVKNPPGLSYIHKGDAETLKIKDQKEFDKLAKNITSGTTALPQESTNTTALTKDLRKIIRQNEGHDLLTSLRQSPKPIVLKSKEDLMKYIGPEDAAYRERQNEWQKIQRRREKWDKVFDRLIREKRRDNLANFSEKLAAIKAGQIPGDNRSSAKLADGIAAQPNQPSAATQNALHQATTTNPAQTQQAVEYSLGSGTPAPKSTTSDMLLRLMGTKSNVLEQVSQKSNVEIASKQSLALDSEKLPGERQSQKLSETVETQKPKTFAERVAKKQDETAKQETNPPIELGGSSFKPR